MCIFLALIEQGKSTEHVCPFPAAAYNTIRQQRPSLFSPTVQMYRFVCYEAYVLSRTSPSMITYRLKLWRACGWQACGSVKINLGGDCHHWSALEQGPLPHYHNRGAPNPQLLQWSCLVASRSNSGCAGWLRGVNFLWLWTGRSWQREHCSQRYFPG